ncbi:MAG: Rpp14/Pop5 family protein [Thaumarchaeota archaeon]|nr:Rpp14/Pop5 family protein [Candidatus Calditenuaceae archaeon]MDW8187290.1 Rpp14/Pop5 family protein [Nitrososphaerota archaeon]
MKRRYLGVRVRSAGEGPSLRYVHGEILRALAQLFGQVGTARAAIKLMWSDESLGVLIIRCSLGSLWKVLLAISTVSTVEDRAVALDVVTTSGSVRKVKERLSAAPNHS